jgi:S-DNA-T family DNA segregation ATPase FtsK/SpoIIIE
MPEQIYYLIIKLLTRLLGLFAVIISFILFLALLSFDSRDPSFNSGSTEEKIYNWMGIWGSHIADLLFQLLGFSAFFLCLIIFSLGAKIASRQGARNLLPKLILTPFCLLFLSIAFSTFLEPKWWVFSSLGGVNGSFILLQINQYAHLPNYLISIIAMLISIVLLSIIIEVSLSDWKYFFRYTVITSGLIFGKIFKFLHKKFLALYDKKLFKFLPASIKTFADIKEEDLPNSDLKKSLLKNKLKNSAKFLENIQEGEEIEILKSQLKTSNKTKEIIKNIKSKSKYLLPNIDLLVDRSNENKDKKNNPALLEGQSVMLLKVLEDFGVYGQMIGAKIGPVVTLYEFEPTSGTKASRVIGLADDIARSMSAVSARIAVIAGKTTIGIELPNLKREIIFLRELITTKDYKHSSLALPIILGKNIGGEEVIVDLTKMPHLLIAGTTGSGKSVGLNVMILSLLFKLPPEECRFIMIDPKMLELSIYDGIPHLLAPVVTEASRAVIALKWVVAEMEERYRLMTSLNVRNIAGYNEKVEKALSEGKKLSRKVQTGYDEQTSKPIIEEIEFEAKKLPFIVVIVDEMADLMLVAGKEIENSVQRLAQMARAAGIHLIMATQRPSVDVITGVIKANFPTRISFQVTSRIDSRTILGTQGAEQLLGQGDMIYMSGGSKMIRVHGPFCSDSEIENIVNFIKSQNSSDLNKIEKVSFEADLAENSDFEGIESDGSKDGDLYKKAVMIVKRDRKASISYVQRQLRIGYNRAATLIEKMEEDGIVSAPNIAGKREVMDD